MSVSDDPRPGDPAQPALPRLLTEDELSRAANWINERAIDPTDPCQVCAGQSIIQPSIVLMNGGVSHTDSAKPWLHPCIVTICSRCGFQRYFNAFVMGILPYPKLDAEGGKNG